MKGFQKHEMSMFQRRNLISMAPKKKKNISDVMASDDKEFEG